MKINSLDNNNTFGALKINCKKNSVRQSLSYDISLNKLATRVEKEYGKDLLVTVNTGCKNGTRWYQPILSVDNGFWHNLLTKIGYGKDIVLCHAHAQNGITQRCSVGMLNNRELSEDKAIEILGLK